MITYLFVIAVICFSASFCVFNYLQCLCLDGQMSQYDARGFFLVMMIFIAFVVISLSYFWGDLRFYPASKVLRESLVGVMHASFCSLFALGYGISQIKGNPMKECPIAQ